MGKILAGVALALSMATSVAHAAPVLGTFAGAFGVTTPGSLINVGSSLGINPGIATSTGTGDLSGISFGTQLTGPTTPLELTNGTMFDFTVAGFGSFSGITSAVALVPGSTVNNRTIQMFALGTFTPILMGYTPGPASITASFTQTGGPKSAVSFSFSFASPPSPPPPPPSVPAPASLALFGLGVSALGLARRNRR